MFGIFLPKECQTLFSLNFKYVFRSHCFNNITTWDEACRELEAMHPTELQFSVKCSLKSFKTPGQSLRLEISDVSWLEAMLKKV